MVQAVGGGDIGRALFSRLVAIPRQNKAREVCLGGSSFHLLKCWSFCVLLHYKEGEQQGSRTHAAIVAFFEQIPYSIYLARSQEASVRSRLPRLSPGS